MKLSKTKKIILLGSSIGILTSIVVPIVVLNNNENNDQEKQNKKDVESIIKIIEEKNEKEKIITLPSNTKGKIIANNQAKIIAKIKTLIGIQNLKEVKIEVSMKNDSNISTTGQKIIIKLTKNEFSKKIEGFLVKKQSIIDVDKDIAAIKNILDSKSGNDLIIILPSSSSGNIVGNIANRNAIIKKLRMLIDLSNKSGEGNHQSLRGTSIQVSMNVDTPISTTLQNIIVSISKASGTTLSTTKTFQVKRDFTASEDILAIKDILDAKTGNDLIITLPSDSSGPINKLVNKNAIERKIRILIDPSNTNGETNHSSLRGTIVSTFVFDNQLLISTTPQNINVIIRKTGGKDLSTTKTFRVKKST